MISSEAFFKILKPSGKESNFVLGKIESAYLSGRPKIVFDGETEASLKRYTYLASYTPVANDRVLLVKVNGSYVVLGKVI